MNKRGLLGVIALVCGCKEPVRAQPEPVSEGASVRAATEADADAGSSLAPLSAPSWREERKLADGSEVIVHVPIGATDRRPVVVGVHGAGDRPDWSCSEWHAVFKGRAFVVCPRGVADARWRGTWVWTSAEQIALRSEAAVADVVARYGAWVEPTQTVYAGWSQGATLAPQVIASRPGRFTHAFLVEIGHTPVDARVAARSLVTGKVERAIISCSTAPCRRFAKGASPLFARAGVPTAVNDVGDRGHVFDGPTFQTLGARLPWLFGADARLGLAGGDAGSAVP